MTAIDWMETFKRCFDQLKDKDRLPRAMKADGCRENWLQAELMLQAEDQGVEIWTNTEKVVGVDPRTGKALRGRYDLSAYYAEDPNKATMVAEVKIIGAFFKDAGKCFTGHALPKPSHPFALGVDGRRLVTDEEIAKVGPRNWSLFGDAARLRLHPAVERYLILVLLPFEDEKATAARRALHAAMQAVRFAPDPHDEGQYDDEKGRFMVRIWRIR